MHLKQSWRSIAMSLVGVCLLTAASISTIGAQPNTAGNRAASAPRVYTPSRELAEAGRHRRSRQGAQATPGAQTAASNIDLPRDPLSPAQRQAYEQSVTGQPPGQEHQSEHTQW